MPPPKDPEKLKLYRQRQSAAHSGEKNHFYGKHHTPETLAVLSEKRIEYFKDETKKTFGKNHPMFGKHHRMDSRNKMSRSHKDVPHNLIHNLHISIALTGIERGKEFGKNVSIRMSGENHPFYGKSRPEHSIKMSGVNNPNWVGGRSYEPYSAVFNESFKKQVRLDYGHCCFFPSCNATIEDSGNELDIHHYDYDKNSKNCIPLCRNHHSKMNKDREIWETFFTVRVGVFWGMKWLEQTYRGGD
jgi:hypothetical protein